MTSQAYDYFFQAQMGQVICFGLNFLKLFEGTLNVTCKWAKNLTCRKEFAGFTYFKFNILHKKNF